MIAHQSAFNLYFVSRYWNKFYKTLKQFSSPLQLPSPEHPALYGLTKFKDSVRSNIEFPVPTKGIQTLCKSFTSGNHLNPTNFQTYRKGPKPTKGNNDVNNSSVYKVNMNMNVQFIKGFLQPTSYPTTLTCE